MQTIDIVRMESRCWNWGRWAYEGTGGVGHCASAEHRYVAPRPDNEKLQNAYALPRIDVGDAECIEAGIVALRCEPDRRFLKMLWVDGRSEKEICRKLHIHPKLFEAFNLRVLGALSYRLEEIAAGRGVKQVVARACMPAADGYIKSATI